MLTKVDNCVILFTLVKFNGKQGERNMKKVLLVILTILGFIGILGTLLYVTTYARSGYSPSSDLIPIKKITGIDTSARLKSGCLISQGAYLPIDDNGMWIALTELFSDNDDFEDIRIIDVYGNNCTITYTTTGGTRYYTTDYPLRNLSYNETAVSKADDGVKTNLHGSHYTLVNDNSKVLLVVSVLLDVVFVGAVIGWVKVKKS